MAWSNYSVPGFHQPLWIVPTRHHAQLAAALALLPLPSGTAADPRELFSGNAADWS
jgi:hypothetical protein